MNEIKIPNNWNCKPLYKIFKSYAGGTPKTGNAEYWNNGSIPWLRSGELKDNILNTSREFITKKGLDESSAKLWSKNSVLIALTGATTGKTALLNFESSGNQSVVGILPSNEILPKFLWYFLQFSYKYFWSKTIGGAQPHINGKIVSELSIVYPDLDLQQKIVKKLDYIINNIYEKQKKISELYNKKLLTNLQNQLSTSFLDLNILEKYTAIPLDKLLIDTRYGTSKKCVYQDVGIPIIRIPNIKSGEIDFSDLKYTELGQFEIDKLQLFSGDIVVCRTNGSLNLIGKTAIIRETKRPFAFASYLIRIRPNTEIINPDFLNYLLLSSLGRKHMEKRAKTTAGQYNINLEILHSIPIPLPSLDEQQKIINQIIHTREQICKINNKIIESKKIQKNILAYLSQSVKSTFNQAFMGRLAY